MLKHFLLAIVMAGAAHAETFTFTQGQAHKVNESTTVTFIAVTSDSRCPANVQCAWAGEATVSLAVTSAGAPATVSLSTTDPKRTHEPSGLTFSLDALQPDPPPVKGPKDYRLTVSIAPAAASPAPSPAAAPESPSPQSSPSPAASPASSPAPKPSSP